MNSKVGDFVQIVGLSELEILLQCYFNSFLFSILCDLDFERVANQIVQIIEIPKSDSDICSIVNVLTPDKFVISLPFAAIIEIPQEQTLVQYSVEEPDDLNSTSPIQDTPPLFRNPSPIFQDPFLIRVRDHHSEYQLVSMIAAETIQHAFRRFKSKSISKSLMQTNRLARDLAVSTIQTAVKKWIRRKHQRERQPVFDDSSQESILPHNPSELVSLSPSSLDELFLQASRETLTGAEGRGGIELEEGEVDSLLETIKITIIPSSFLHSLPPQTLHIASCLRPAHVLRTLSSYMDQSRDRGKSFLRHGSQALLLPQDAQRISSLLLALCQGPWPLVRETLLSLPPPILWKAKETSILLKCLNCPETLWDLIVSGTQFLSPTFLSSLPSLPSIMLMRLRIHQLTLLLVQRTIDSTSLPSSVNPVVLLPSQSSDNSEISPSSSSELSIGLEVQIISRDDLLSFLRGLKSHPQNPPELERVASRLGGQRVVVTSLSLLQSRGLVGVIFKSSDKRDTIPAQILLPLPLASTKPFQGKSIQDSSLPLRPPISIPSQPPLLTSPNASGSFSSIPSLSSFPRCSEVSSLPLPVSRPLSRSRPKSATLPRPAPQPQPQRTKSFVKPTTMTFDLPPPQIPQPIPKKSSKPLVKPQSRPQHYHEQFDPEDLTFGSREEPHSEWRGSDEVTKHSARTTRTSRNPSFLAPDLIWEGREQRHSQLRTREARRTERELTMKERILERERRRMFN